MSIFDSMKPRLPIQIAIPQPCNEDWENMTPREQGRYCSSCQKCVTDFTGFSDEDLYRFLMDNIGVKVCGRFKSNQLNRDILPHIPPQPHSQLYKWMIAAGLALIFSVTPESNLFAQAPVQQTQVVTTVENEEEDTEGDSTVTITGTVVDENDEPIISAVVEVIVNEKVIAGSLTDIDGKYSIENIPVADMELLTRYIGYTSIRTIISKSEIRNNNVVDISMSPSLEEIITGILIRVFDPTLYDVHSTGNNRTISGDEIHNMSR